MSLFSISDKDCACRGYLLEKATDTFAFLKLLRVFHPTWWKAQVTNLVSILSWSFGASKTLGTVEFPSEPKRSLDVKGYQSMWFKGYVNNCYDMLPFPSERATVKSGALEQMSLERSGPELPKPARSVCFFEMSKWFLLHLHCPIRTVLRQNSRALRDRTQAKVSWLEQKSIKKSQAAFRPILQTVLLSIQQCVFIVFNVRFKALDFAKYVWKSALF